MAGVVKLPNGKLRGWYIDWRGKQVFLKIVADVTEKEVKQEAEAKEHHDRLIRGGHLPPPKASDAPRPFADVAAEYLAWGTAQGGHGGRAWSPVHLDMRTRHLTKFWPKRLNLSTLTDISLPKTEAVARELLDAKKCGKTVQTHIESLKALCLWAKGRGYLDADPLEGFVPLDVTPKTTRRAMVVSEIVKLLDAAPADRRTIYETALCTGYRKGELAALTVAGLDAERCSLSLAAKHCKGRKDSRQPIPASLAAKLKDACKGRPANAPLFNVDFHIDRLFAADLVAANVPDIAPGGKLVFHSLRHTYCSLVIESGASLTEAQRLLRHVDPRLTANVYSHARQDRLQCTAEAVGGKVIYEEKYAGGMQRVAVGAEAVDVKACDAMTLECVGSEAGEGVRTLDFDLGKIADALCQSWSVGAISWTVKDMDN